MTRRTTPALPGRLAASVPLAPALLLWEGRLWYWVVASCPFCGRRHRHGGGLAGVNPRDFLGGRVAHCGTGEWREYTLVEQAT